MPSAAIFAVSLASTAYGGYTSYQAAKQQGIANRNQAIANRNQAIAQQQAADYQAQVAQRNANIEAQNARSKEAQANYEKVVTQNQIDEERARAHKNLLRAQEEKRSALAKQRAQFAASGITTGSPSAQLIIGELGDDLQTRIQDMFFTHGDRMATIQNAGNNRFFSALQASRNHMNRQSSYLNQKTAAGIDSVSAGNRATFAELSADSAMRASSLAATSAVIGTVGSMASSTFDAKQNGLFG